MLPPLDSPRRRILFAGGMDMTRRLRMTSKVIAECRRRGIKFNAIACGNVPEEFVRSTAPDEIHVDLDEAELVNLFTTATVILECASDPGEVSAAAAFARAVGTPVLSCAGAGVRNGVVVTEWIADAFADALQHEPFGRDAADDAAVPEAAAGMAAVLE